MSDVFFFFGSLRDPLILEAVLGRNPANLSHEPGWLDGHRIERAKGYTFPLLSPDPTSAAEGVLTWGLSSEDRRRIAYFEDSEYEMVKKSVRGRGGTIEAQVYVGSDKLHSSGDPWDLHHFKRHDRPLLHAVTRFVMTEHYPKTPQADIERLWSSIQDRIAREMGIEPNA